MGDGFSDFFYSASDGLKLHARVYEPPENGALPVVCLPGLSRNARDFHGLALRLARHPEWPRKVIVFDYRGRGLSAHDRDWRNYTVPREADDVLAGMTALGIENGAFIGTSRGGLIVMVLAALRPSVLKAVVLNDIGPVIGGAGLAQIRAYLERAPKPRDWADAVSIQRAIHGDSFSALAEEDWQRLVRALYRETPAGPVADYDPALVRTLTSVDISEPLPEMWPQFEALSQLPLMVVRGENSKLLSTATVEEMSRRHPGMRAVTAEGQGHAPLLETGRLPEEIAAFLAEAETTGPR